MPVLNYIGGNVLSVIAQDSAVQKTVDIAPRSVDSPNCPTVIRRIVMLMTTCRVTPAQSEDSSS